MNAAPVKPMAPNVTATHMRMLRCATPGRNITVNCFRCKSCLKNS